MAPPCPGYRRGVESVGLAGPLLRRLGIDPGIKRYVAVGVRPDEIEVTVTLERRGERRDVSDSCSMVSLRPFRLAIASPADPGEQPADLWFEGSDRRQLGHLRIEPIGRTGPDRGYPLYRTVGSRDACVGRAELWANYLRFEVERRKRISAKDPFPLVRLSLWSILIFYIRASSGRDRLGRRCRPRQSLPDGYLGSIRGRRISHGSAQHQPQRRDHAPDQANRDGRGSAGVQGFGVCARGGSYAPPGSQ